MSMSLARTISRQCCVCLWALLVSTDTPAAYVPVFGGPEYDSSTMTGYNFQAQSRGMVVNNSGTAVGYGDKLVLGAGRGTGAVRWDGTGMTPVELGDLGSNSNDFAYCFTSSINNSGTIAGYSEKYLLGTFLGSRAVWWDTSSTTPTELGDLGTDSAGYTVASASAMNDAGTVVGTAQKYVDGSYLGDRAVRWDGPGTNATELENLGTGSRAVAVNSTGTVVGFAVGYSGGNSSFHAMRWDGSGTSVVALDLPATGGSSQAYAVNDSGTTVGSVYNQVHHAVRWDGSGTSVIELGHLGTDRGASVAFDLNHSGVAVGWSEKIVAGTYYGTRAVRWDGSNTAATELGNLGTDNDGITLSSANAVNSGGIAVGRANTYVAGVFDNSHAVAWTPDASAIDLNALIDPASGWILTEANDISDTGWITGTGWYDPDGPGGLDAYGRLFLLQLPQVPEPATSSLLAFAGSAAFAARPRRPGDSRRAASQHDQHLLL